MLILRHDQLFFYHGPCYHSNKKNDKHHKHNDKTRIKVLNQKFMQTQILELVLNFCHKFIFCVMKKLVIPV